MERIALVILLLVPLSACSPARRGETLVLDSFESGSSLERWEGPAGLSREYPAQGKGSLELDLGEGRRRFLESEKLPRDWSAYQWLKFDIYNPEGRIGIGSIQIMDELGSDEQAAIEGQSYRGRKVFLNKGWNHYELKLTSLMVENGDRALALDRIRRFRLDFGPLEGKLYLDNFRLVSGEESPETASAADPRDCRVVIDNRYVYPGLAGPEEKIVPGREILGLRDRAGREVERLEEQVELAELQGYQTYYWRIPLITAQVGLGIRGKLVWFSSEQEERKILEYVISSCSEASQQVEELLTARGESQEEPEDEVNPQHLYVPPYPPLKGLRQWGGYFRDSRGEPVIVLSMLNVNSGPLLDYFAPFNHRLESYT
ncbi:MAG: hypothetical protein JXQ83_01325, partial [Candidatus Glassbacteria bacterium]|nr:hypothetical protein [Candidatus Glassbacteria bacterium]